MCGSTQDFFPPENYVVSLLRNDKVFIHPGKLLLNHFSSTYFQGDIKISGSLTLWRKINITACFQPDSPWIPSLSKDMCEHVHFLVTSFELCGPVQPSVTDGELILLVRQNTDTHLSQCPQQVQDKGAISSLLDIKFLKADTQMERNSDQFFLCFFLGGGEVWSS